MLFLRPLTTSFATSLVPPLTDTPPPLLLLQLLSALPTLRGQFLLPLFAANYCCHHLYCQMCRWLDSLLSCCSLWIPLLFVHISPSFQCFIISSASTFPSSMLANVSILPSRLHIFLYQIELSLILSHGTGQQPSTIPAKLLIYCAISFFLLEYHNLVASCPCKLLFFHKNNHSILTLLLTPFVQISVSCQFHHLRDFSVFLSTQSGCGMSPWPETNTWALHLIVIHYRD